MISIPPKAAGDAVNNLTVMGSEEEKTGMAGFSVLIPK